MITDRDRRILKYMETYKYATLEQIRKVFFKEQKNGYNIARRRMGEMRKANYLKVDRNIENNKLVYMWNEKDIKMPSRHRLILLDVLANLHYLGFNVQLFEIEKYWHNGKIRSDGFTVFTLNNVNVKNRYHYFIEIHTSNNNYNLQKYDLLYETGEVQRYLGRNIFPRVMLVTDYIPRDMQLQHTKVVTLNTKLDEFATVALP